MPEADRNNQTAKKKRRSWVHYTDEDLRQTIQEVMHERSPIIARLAEIAQERKRLMQSKNWRSEKIRVLCSVLCYRRRDRLKLELRNES